jgi:hypothetical protein
VAAAWIVTAWYMAFQLNVVLGAAAGDAELPALSVTDGWWDGVVAPFLKMLATTAIAYLPMFVFLLSAGAASVLGNLSSTGGGLSALLQLLDVKTLVVAGALLLAGGFLWPMLVLMVAVGSLGSLVRVDLIARTIARSLPAYLLTVAAVYVSLALQVGFAALLGAVTKTTGNPLQAPAIEWLLPPVLQLAEVYFTILAMRAIGFYYHHFKHRFAWSWG